MRLVWIAGLLILMVASAYVVWSRRAATGEPYHLLKTVQQHPNGSWSEPVLHSETAAFIGKQLVIAIRYPVGGNETVVHVYGPIVRISEHEGIVINRADGRGDFAIPPRAFLVSEHQRETRPTSMTEIIRPDYSTLLTLDGPPSEHGWNPATDRER